MSQVNIQGGIVQGLDKLETLRTGHTALLGRRTGIGMSKRFELEWTAGQGRRPALNAVLVWPVTYTAATAIAIEVADKDFEILGVNMTTALVTYNAEGGITITTAGADSDEAIINPHLDTNQSAWEQVTWGTDKEVEWECFIQTGANIGDAIIWAGLKLTNTEVVATDADQVFFRYEDAVNSGKWQAVSSIAGIDSADDSGVAAVVVSTQYHLKITIDDQRIARMYINDVLVKTTAALTDVIDLNPYIGVAADGAAAAKAIDVYGQAISRVYG